MGPSLSLPLLDRSLSPDLIVSHRFSSSHGATNTIHPSLPSCFPRRLDVFFDCSTSRFRHHHINTSCLLLQLGAGGGGGDEASATDVATIKDGIRPQGDECEMERKAARGRRLLTITGGGDNGRSSCPPASRPVQRSLSIFIDPRTPLPARAA